MSIPFISVFQTNICIHKPFLFRIINPAPQIIQSRLLIIHIPTIAERIQRTNRRCQTAGFADRITPRIITIFYHLRTIRVNQRNRIALQIVDIEVIDIVIGDHTGLTLRIIEEMQIMAALHHVDDIFAIQRIVGRYAVDNLFNSQAVFQKAKSLTIWQMPIAGSCTSLI